jgi:(p)ppGpp synthase/HD superfamily hydrolase
MIPPAPCILSTVTEDMAIAALLHDAVEDEGGLPRLRDIEAKFGNKVAKIVEGCTDSFVEYPDKKQEWEERKSSYIERLWNEPPETLLVSVADKLYNARAMQSSRHSEARSLSPGDVGRRACARTKV